MSFEKYKKPLWLGAKVVIGLWLIVLLISLVIIGCLSTDASARWGQFGDAFGIVNALFSGFALLGVVAALLIQREDIDLQLEEMRKSADVQAAAVAMQERQVRIAALAEMLRATHAMIEYLRHNEQQPHYRMQGDKSKTKLETYTASIPRIVELLEKEIGVATSGDINA